MKKSSLYFKVLSLCLVLAMLISQTAIVRSDEPLKKKR